MPKLSLTIAEVYTLNAYVCAGVGLPANFLLLWLIHRHTKPEMRAFSLILLQTCLCDIFTLVEQTILLPFFFAGDGEVPVCVLLGPLASSVSFPWNVLLVMGIWVLCFKLIKHQFLVQFFHRWLQITKSRKMSFWVYFGLLLMPTVLNTLASTFLFDFGAIAERRGLSSSARVIQSIGLSPAQTQNPMIQNINSTYFHLEYWQSICWDLMSLAVKLVLAFLTSRFVRRNLHGPNAARDRDLHRQLNRALILQLTLAFTIGYAPSVLLIVQMVWPSTAAVLGLWTRSMTSAVYFWVPALNPFVTMVIIKSYRIALAKALRNCWNQCIRGCTDENGTPSTGHPMAMLNTTVHPLSPNNSNQVANNNIGGCQNQIVTRVSPMNFNRSVNPHGIVVVQ